MCIDKKHYFINKSVEVLCLEYGKLLQVKKDTIFFEEDSMKAKPYVYYLVEGICSISGNSMEGQEQTFLYLMPGEMLGHVPYIMSKGAHSILYSYQRPVVMAKTECLVYKIPADCFVTYMENNLGFSNYLNQLLAQNYSMALAHLKQVQEESSVIIICRFLLQMSQDTAEGKVVPKIFTYKEIATYFGIHEVTVARIIGQFKQAGYVERIQVGLKIINKEALQEIVLNRTAFKYYE